MNAPFRFNARIGFRRAGRRKVAPAFGVRVASAPLFGRGEGFNAKPPFCRRDSPKPRTDPFPKERKFEDVVKDAEQAAVLVLVC